LDINFPPIFRPWLLGSLVVNPNPKIVSNAWYATTLNYFSAIIPPMKMNHHLAPPTGGRGGVRDNAGDPLFRFCKYICVNGFWFLVSVLLSL